MRNPRALARLLALSVLLCLAGCYTVRPSNGGGENVVFQGDRRVNPADVAAPPGYRVDVLASGLDCPTGVCIDEHGAVYVTETSVEGDARVSRLLRIDAGGAKTIIAQGLNGPWDGVAYYHGDFYVSEGGYNSGGPILNIKNVAPGAEGLLGDTQPVPSGRILKITAQGKITPLVENLPSLGEFHTTGPVISSDGYIYFGQGAATNSGIVGMDDEQLGWLDYNHRFHDIPGQDIKLSGENVQTPDSLSPGNVKVTGAFSPYGQPTVAGQAISAQVPGTGAILRAPLAGGPPELVAWGFRNPFGLALDSQGQLFTTDESYEDRGSRPVSGCGDLLWAVKPAVWYGWPDFYGDRPLSGSRQFAAVGKPQPRALLAEYPNTPPKPQAVFGMHAGAAGLDFCPAGDFGDADEAFVAEFGDLSPFSGKVLAPVGFDVLRVDRETGVSHVFAANRSDHTGPASKLGSGGLERPIALRFDPTGAALYIVDYGVVTVGAKPQSHPRTGVVWKITREESP